MSKYIDEIIEDIKKDPTSWKDYEGRGIQKQNMKITQYGNTALLSIIDVRINDKNMPTTYRDRYKLELVIGKWYRTVSLMTISL